MRIHVVATFWVCCLHATKFYVMNKTTQRVNHRKYKLNLILSLLIPKVSSQIKFMSEEIAYFYPKRSMRKASN